MRFGHGKSPYAALRFPLSPDESGKGLSPAIMSLPNRARLTFERPLHNLEIGFRKRALEIFRGTLPPQRSDCEGNV